jgi:hypothetical protein
MNVRLTLCFPQKRSYRFVSFYVILLSACNPDRPVPSNVWKGNNVLVKKFSNVTTTGGTGTNWHFHATLTTVTEVKTLYCGPLVEKHWLQPRSVTGPVPASSGHRVVCTLLSVPDRCKRVRRAGAGDVLSNWINGWVDGCVERSHWSQHFQGVKRGSNFFIRYSYRVFQPDIHRPTSLIYNEEFTHGYFMLWCIDPLLIRL